MKLKSNYNRIDLEPSSTVQSLVDRTQVKEIILRGSFMSNAGFLLLHPNLKLDGHRREARHEEGRAAAATSRSTTTGRSFHDVGELKNRIESIYEAIGRIYALPSPVSFSGVYCAARCGCTRSMPSIMQWGGRAAAA